MSRLVTAFAGSLIEAWAELRVHRLRVLLSLVGVAVAVCALAGVVAAGGIAGQASRENSEQYGGRPASFSVTMSPSGDVPVDTATAVSAFDQTVERYGITYASRATTTARSVQFAHGVRTVSTTVVDVPYAEMHRIQMLKGRWFGRDDATRLAPALVVNEAFWSELGEPDLATHPTVSLLGTDEVVGVVTGVVRSRSYDLDPALFVLPSDRDLEVSFGDASESGPSDLAFEVWLPPAVGEKLGARLKSDLASALAPDVQVGVDRRDYLANGAEDPTVILTQVISGVALLILLLGGLGLVNVSLVTVKQRIREIGIRRSFGATGSRVFFAVILESVAGTAVAGVVGVAAAVWAIRLPIVQAFLTQGALSDPPPFPLAAAGLGLLAAVAVGALAGLLPALVAVRVKVIDAIRY